MSLRCPLKSTNRPLAAAGLLAACLPAFAQTAATPPAAAASAPAPATADAPARPADARPANAPQEIVISAQKRTERLQDAAASVSVANAEQLEAAGVRQIEDLAKLAPSLNITTSSGQLHSTLSARGVSVSAIAPGVPSAVGVVLDDVPQPPEARGYQYLADIERIEVLSGPQSTISGRNAAAGLINIVTRSPSEVFEGNLSATLTTDNEWRVSGLVSGRIAPGWTGSFSAYGSDWDGNAKNLLTDRTEGNDNRGFRAKLRWAPRAGVDVMGTVYHQSSNEEQGRPIFQYVTPGAAFFGFVPFNVIAAPYAASLGAAPSSDNKVAASFAPAFQRTTSNGGSLRASLDVGRLQLQSITGLQREDVNASQDVFGLPNPTAPGSCNCQTSTVKTDTVSQEFRLLSPATDALSYVLGAFYLDTSVDYDFVRNGQPRSSSIKTATLQNTAVYGRATAKLNESFNLLGGLRYNHEKIGYVYNNRIAGATTRGDASDGVVLGDLSLQYRPTKDVMLYARYARGHQGQVFDLDAPFSATAPLKPVEPETIDSWELGTKSQWFDRALTTNVTLFHTRYKNYQGQLATVTPTALLFNFLNVGEVLTKGLEAQVDWRATPTLRLTSSAAYNDAKHVSYTNAGCWLGQTADEGCVGGIQDLSGKRLNGTPKLRVNLGIEKWFDLEQAPVDLTVRADGVWQTATNFDLTHNPRTVQDRYGVLNLSARFDDKAGKYSVTLFVNNALNQHYVNFLQDRGGFWGNRAMIVSTGLPLDWQRYGGVKVSYNF